MLDEKGPEELQELLDLMDFQVKIDS